jgi:hypothetical protein
MPSTHAITPPKDAAQALVALCAGILPVWERQLAASRAQSEVAVGQMLKAFADIGPHIDMAERQSRQISDALSPNDGGIVGLVAACEARLSPLLQDASLPAASRDAISQVLAMVRSAVHALQSISQPFAHETQMVAQQVEHMYTGFQYQDRISQMMALLEADMARLRSALNNPTGEVPQIDLWMAQLESQYAMAEQRDNHVQARTNGPGGPKEAEFF